MSFRAAALRPILPAMRACLCALVLLAGLGRAVSAAEEREERRAHDFYQEALQAFQDRQLDRALALLRQAWDIEPKPIYAYNIATVQESMGRFAEAHAGMLRVPGHPACTDELRRLAEARLARLETKRKSAWVRWQGQGAQTVTVQVAETVLSPDGTELQLEPSSYVICEGDTAKRVMDCRERTLVAGRRYDLPLARDAEPAATLLLQPSPELRALRLEETLLQLDPTQPWQLRVQPGSHRVTLVDRSGRQETQRVLALEGSQHHLRMPPLKPSPQDVSESSASYAPWIVSGLGVVAAGVGGWLIADGRGLRNDVNDAPVDEVGRRQGLTEVQARNRWERGNTRSRWGVAVASTGAAVAAAGLIWGLLWTMDTPAAPASVALSPAGASASLRLRF